MSNKKIFDESLNQLIRYCEARDKYTKVASNVIDEYKKMWTKHNLPETVTLKKPFQCFTYDHAKSIIEKITLLPDGEFKLHIRTISSDKLWSYVDKNFVSLEYFIYALSSMFTEVSEN